MNNGHACSLNHCIRCGECISVPRVLCDACRGGESTTLKVYKPYFPSDAPVEEKRTLAHEFSEYCCNHLSPQLTQVPCRNCVDKAQIAETHFKEEGFVKLGEVLRVFDEARATHRSGAIDHLNIAEHHYLRQALESMRKEP